MLEPSTRQVTPTTRLKRPKLRNNLRIEVIEPETVFVILDGDHRIFSGSVFRHLMPLLDGQLTDVDLMLRLDGIAYPHQVMRALGQLHRQGLLVDGEDATAPAESAYWQTLGVEGQLARQRLAEAKVKLLTLGSADSTPLTTALSAVGVLPYTADDYTCTVVVTDDYLRSALQPINREALANGKPWLLVKLIGRMVWIGPLFVPGETACWQCLAQRVTGNRQVEAYIQSKKASDEPLPTSRPGLTTTLEMAANIAANEVVKWLATGSYAQLGNQLLTLDTISLQTRKHAVIKRPQCQACGGPRQANSAEPPPFVLHPSPKKSNLDGGHRTLLPEETFARYQHHISPITGVVSSLVSRIEMNGITYSYTAGHNFALWGDNMSMLRKNMRSQSGGKGRTRIQAQVSGLCEAIERYSGVYRDPQPHALQASYRELGSERAIHPYEVLLYSQKQYAHRHEWNAQLDAPFNLVTDPFDEDIRIQWTPVWSLTNNRAKYIPSAYCYYGHPDMHYFFCGSDSNGCAAGNTPEEAILQGFLELAERDAVAMWWYNRLRYPGVDLASFNTPYFQQLQAFYAQINRSLWVLDLTSDLGVPTFVAVSGRLNREVEDIVVGFGAHLDASIAIMRALTEANQFLPSVMMENPDGTTRYTLDKGAIKWFQTAKMATEHYLLPDDKRPFRTAADYRNMTSADLSHEVMTCVEMARRVGLETFVLDQTLPDIGLNVFRVIVPGIRHFWRRLAPGRLYDVPVRMGWLAAPVAEEDLNAHSLFF